MKQRVIPFTCLALLLSTVLSAAEFTISSYNCGGLSDHYDYLRAACMQKLVQERYNAEPETMALNDKIQQVSLKILFAKTPQARAEAKQIWSDNNYESSLATLTASPTEPNSPNASWNAKSEDMITTYKIRPVKVSDEEVAQMLAFHLSDLTNDQNQEHSVLLTKSRHIMAKRIFQHQLKYDILCLQEADYLDESVFPENYAVRFSDTGHSVNGIAWNKDRFEEIETLGNIMGRAFAMKLLDKTTGKIVLVASGHLTGCNPFKRQTDAQTSENDSAKGDNELQAVVDLFEEHAVDIKLIGMDSNVTSTHPRLEILANSNYSLDAENFLEPTCTNPHQVLNTRIDWIALKTTSDTTATVTNIPVVNVGLNSIQTNISDHKPIAAKIEF